ncbi:hypothetical protein [Muricauda sp. MAR_2010_75]|uniref:hypothetical protein n=1 Tax=Allomuricauda sp. MAR_2010_75 TaxID=1250232 RepID=UPI001E4AAA01|nr:hypothetical protein [Muricauda sp. MAR_2010_75]
MAVSQESRRPWKNILNRRASRSFFTAMGATIVTMNKKLTVEELQGQLNKLEGYTIAGD